MFVKNYVHTTTQSEQDMIMKHFVKVTRSQNTNPGFN